MLPAICTEERITLGAEMANGTVIRGQNEISHPSAPGAALLHALLTSQLLALCMQWEGLVSNGQSASQRAPRGLTVRHSAESPGPIRVEKHGRGPPLAAPVRRIFYLSAEGTMREHEVFPPPNPRLLAQVDCADAIVYGMGSLYTSICPSLVLKVRALTSAPARIMTALYTSICPSLVLKVWDLASVPACIMTSLYTSICPSPVLKV